MKRTLGVAGLTAVLSLAALAVAPSASASTADRNACLSGFNVCVWQNTNWGGNRFAANSSWTGNCANSLTLGHSVANGGPRSVRFYSADGCTGSYFDIRADDYSASTPFAVHSFKRL
ncbi:peptidase inhibitor family I36 protein [Streptomyces sp. NPDC051677]|uniref:peptidase inhibitor family I36 protein n=1 Tax=Streptomyces sp. NPDC051677 TaxID=3365669 RepID=UPI0037D55968